MLTHRHQSVGSHHCRGRIILQFRGRYNHQISIIMEQLNRIELRGIVGNARIQNIGDTEMARFSVATDHAFKNRSGEAVIETTCYSNR